MYLSRGLFLIGVSDWSFSYKLQTVDEAVLSTMIRTTSRWAFSLKVAIASRRETTISLEEADNPNGRRRREETLLALGS
jgi:hypothetical protein